MMSPKAQLRTHNFRFLAFIFSLSVFVKLYIFMSTWLLPPCLLVSFIVYCLSSFCIDCNFTVFPVCTRNGLSIIIVVAVCSVFFVSCNIVCFMHKIFTICLTLITSEVSTYFALYYDYYTEYLLM